MQRVRVAVVGHRAAGRDQGLGGDLAAEDARDDGGPAAAAEDVAFDAFQVEQVEQPGQVGVAGGGAGGIGGAAGAGGVDDVVHQGSVPFTAPSTWR